MAGRPDPYRRDRLSEDRAIMVRTIASVLALLGLVWILIDTIILVNDASDIGASAIQVTQVYAERTFYAVIDIGLLIAVYVLTRRTP